MYQKWIYVWHHKPSGKSGQSETFREMTPLQFLSALTWWNMGGGCDYTYFPCYKQSGILPQHECRNVTN